MARQCEQVCTVGESNYGSVAVVVQRFEKRMEKDAQLRRHDGMIRSQLLQCRGRDPNFPIPKACDPRDLIDHSIDRCRLQRQPVKLTEQGLEVVWKGYFGQPRTDPKR